MANEFVKSEDPRYLPTNAATLDEYVHSDSDTFRDRLGRERLTIKGIEHAAGDASLAVQAATNARDSEQAARSSEQTAAANAAASGAAKALAEAARDAAALAALTAPGLYATEAEGRLAVADGETFHVVGAGAVAALIYRRIDAVSSEEIASIPSSKLIQDAILQNSVGNILPLIGYKDQSGVARVAIWLDRAGNLNAYGAGEYLKDSVLDGVVNKTKKHNFPAPLVVAGGKAIMWLAADGIHSPSIDRKIDRDTADTRYAKTEDVSGKISESVADARYARKGRYEIPIATDGRSLIRLRQKLGRIRAGDTSAKVRIAFVGDSWSALPNIPVAMIGQIKEATGISAQGVWARAAAGDPSGAHWPWQTVTYSAGWSTISASSSSDWATYKPSADGFVAYTSQAARTIKTQYVKGTSLRIHTRAHGGTWRYRIDGGAWQTVVEVADGSLTVTPIIGLSDGDHTVEIDTTGNTGVVVYCGIMNETPEPFQIIKLGNPGLGSGRFRDFISLAGDAWADINPDLVILQIGTNDYRYNNNTIPYEQGLTALSNMMAAHLPGAGLIVAVPAQSNGVAMTPLSAYRDAAWRHEQSTGCELMNLLDAWGSFDVSSGMWADDVHVSEAGARVIASQLIKNFI